ncbi:hypothetical protein EWF20_06005 [Sulfolobus sp. S-194]|uniref:hypothetical protein n=1 Tax=Sulfolobus sp. S-194 TaxID=2512240 RepID=UPI0014372121|nr:hypothetical protein [Sulfolobus sp. S-194]QIW23755.1 hypothetical protein EWF20_06005 [Sulfolobus sp. S-194]
MKVILKSQYYPFFGSVLDKYQKLLEFSSKLLANLSINIEEIYTAKLSVLDRSYYSPVVKVLNPHVITLAIDKNLEIKTKIRDENFIWRESYLRVEFLGKIEEEEAILVLTIRGSGQERKKYGDVELYAYNSNFDGFDKLFIRHKINIEKALTEEVKYFVIAPLSSLMYDLSRIIAISASDVRSFLALVTRFLRGLSTRENIIEKAAVSKLNSFLNLSTLYAKVYNQEKFVKATFNAFREKGYVTKAGSITIYGDKPLYEGYINFLEKVIIPLMSDFPSQDDFEKRLEKGLNTLS